MGEILRKNVYKNWAYRYNQLFSSEQLTRLIAEFCCEILTLLVYAIEQQLFLALSNTFQGITRTNEREEIYILMPIFGILLTLFVYTFALAIFKSRQN